MPDRSLQVSVVMVVLDAHPQYLRQAIESVLSQTLRDLELIIVEDPSARSGAELVRGLGDPRIRYFANPARTSLEQQRNQALAAARAELVAVLDADDVCEPDRLEAQVAFLRQHPDVGVLGSQLAIIGPDSEPLGYRSYPTEHEAIRRALRRFNPIAQPAVMFRKAVVQAAGGYRFGLHQGMAEDYELWCRLAKRGERFANHPRALLRYRIHGGASKSRKLRSLLRATIEIKKSYWRGEMEFPDRVRLWAERVLLLCPPPLVGWLFRRTNYTRELPALAA